jgi:heparinase II/III-like protein
VSMALRPVTMLRRIGPHPVMLGRMANYAVRKRLRRRRLRTRYEHAVVRVPQHARLRPPTVELGTAAALPAPLRDAADRLRREAEAILAHRVDYLGSGPVELGPQIDWQRDFKSGYRWPSVHYADLVVTRLHDSSDAKMAWELSRGHQLLTLARAAVLFEDEAFAAELEAQLGAWIEGNPVGVGINWSMPMEISLRAVNWLWAIGTLEGWRPLDADLRVAVTRSLQSHGRHVLLNLEGSPLLRSNHHVSNILCLLALGLCVEEDPAARRWERVGRRGLERAIRQQVYADGADFEASMPYHGLVLEMLLVAWDLAARAGRPLSDGYRDRLAAMLEVSRSLRHPAGRTPVFGDNDSGRVLPAGFARGASQDHLLGTGAALLDGAGPAHEEVAWNQGIPAWRALAERGDDSRPPTTHFPQGGYYVLTGGGTQLFARWGEVGQNGNGGHAHNDLGSFELSVGQDVLVVDSGTHAYTADIEARNASRSARAHNVLVVDGRDPHPVPADTPFAMRALARFRVEEWDDGRRLVAGHDGFARQGAGGWARREIALDPASGAVDVVDTLEGTGSEHELESFLHLAAGVTAERIDESTVAALKDGRGVTIRFNGADAVEIEGGWVSEAYGKRDAAPIVKATARARTPARLSYRIEPVDPRRKP